METNGTTRIEMDTMHAIISASESLASIAESLKKLAEKDEYSAYKRVERQLTQEYVEEYLKVADVPDVNASEVVERLVDDYYGVDEDDVRSVIEYIISK